MTDWEILNKGIDLDYPAIIKELEERSYLLQYGMTKQTKEALDQFDQELEELLSDEG
jgi:hypothetical protein